VASRKPAGLPIGAGRDGDLIERTQIRHRERQLAIPWCANTKCSETGVSKGTKAASDDRFNTKPAGSMLTSPFSIAMDHIFGPGHALLRRRTILCNPCAFGAITAALSACETSLADVAAPHRDERMPCSRGSPTTCCHARGPRQTGSPRRWAKVVGRAEPTTVTGCGTSEHPAQSVAALKGASLGPGQRRLVTARPALTAVDRVCRL
jgi:hypothetical protein